MDANGFFRTIAHNFTIVIPLQPCIGFHHNFSCDMIPQINYEHVCFSENIGNININLSTPDFGLI